MPVMAPFDVRQALACRSVRDKLKFVGHRVLEETSSDYLVKLLGPLFERVIAKGSSLSRLSNRFTLAFVFQQVADFFGALLCIAKGNHLSVRFEECRKISLIISQKAGTDAGRFKQPNVRGAQRRNINVGIKRYFRIVQLLEHFHTEDR